MPSSDCYDGESSQVLLFLLLRWCSEWKMIHLITIENAVDYRDGERKRDWKWEREINLSCLGKSILRSPDCPWEASRRTGTPPESHLCRGEYLRPPSTWKSEEEAERNSLKIHPQGKNLCAKSFWQNLFGFLSYFTVFSVAICPQGLKA